MGFEENAMAVRLRSPRRHARPAGPDRANVPATQAKISHRKKTLARKQKSRNVALVVPRPLFLPHAACMLIVRAQLFPRVARVIGALVIAAACQAGEQPLSTCAEILGLTVDQARQRRPVDIEGVVVLEHLEAAAVVVHDATNAIFVRTDQGGDVKRGNRVRVRGFTDPGLFAPIVVQPTFELLGSAEMPMARAVHLSELMEPQLDAQWVEVSGIVRDVVPRPDWPGDSVMEIVSDDVRVSVVLNAVIPEAARTWIDSKVRFRAVCFHLYNDKRQLFGVKLAVPEGEPVRMLERGARDPYALPLRSPEDLLRYNRAGPELHRVRLRGVVTYGDPGEMFFLQDGNRGIEVTTRQRTGLRVGAVLDVVGFVGRSGHGPKLEDAEFKIQPVAKRIDAPRISTTAAGAWDNALVRVEARLLSVIRELDFITLVLETSDGICSARARWPYSREHPAAWDEGTTLEVTGICRVIVNPERQNEFIWLPQSVQILFRSADDVAILKQPPFWESRYAFRVLIAFIGLTVLTTLGIYLRYRTRIREQQRNRSAAEREFTAVLRERNRVAREIHDTLAQGLTSISAQIELAKERLAQSPESALRHLQLAREMVQGSLADARRSIWALRPQVLESQPLRGALEQIGRQLTSGSRVAVHVRESGSRVDLPSFLEIDLLRIGQEAITNAVRHGRPSRVEVELQYSPGWVRLRVTDNGCGMERATEFVRSAGREGFGLIGMQERAKQMRGSLEMRAARGGGTEMLLEVPI
jgi:signal transduction histidine kinase